jgi:hypothetical protein
MPRTSSLSRLSIEDLKREIAQRQRRNVKLERKRQTLLRRLAVIEREMGVRPGRASVPEAGRTRPKNAMNLADTLRKVLTGKVMSIKDAIAAVQKAGYRSSSSNFRGIVSIALGDRKVFKRVKRGEYTSVAGSQKHADR